MLIHFMLGNLFFKINLISPVIAFCIAIYNYLILYCMQGSWQLCRMHMLIKQQLGKINPSQEVFEDMHEACKLPLFNVLKTNPKYSPRCTYPVDIRQQKLINRLSYPQIKSWLERRYNFSLCLKLFLRFLLPLASAAGDNSVIF